MADMKFSCPQCGQHISCGEPWAGHQIECPACHNYIVVPQTAGPSAPPPASAAISQSPTQTGPRLAAGATQTPRSTAPPPAPTRKFTPTAPRSDNSLLKYGLMLAVVAALAGAGYFYGLPLITHALQQEPAGNSRGGAQSGTMGGPMGEVNGAMDASETLDAGSSSPRSRPVHATNNVAPPRPVRPPQ